MECIFSIILYQTWRANLYECHDDSFILNHGEKSAIIDGRRQRNGSMGN